MRVVDHEPQLWFLLEEDGALYFDGHYSHGAAGYDFMIRLNQAETARYYQGGRTYLGRLAAEIQDAVPILADSLSAYQGRRLPQAWIDKAVNAILRWRAAGGRHDGPV